ncbi:MAG: hypothetical protein Kow009_04640 [Spirochaetales bacterium]
MRISAAVPLCIMGLFLSVWGSNLGAQTLDLDPIETLVKEGKGEEALPLIESLLSHFPKESDLLYLKGKADPHELDSLEKALQYDNWNRYRDMDGRFLLVERYLRRKRFKDAQRVLNGLNGKGAPLPEYWYALSQTLLGLGERNQAFQTLRKALSLFPKDPRFLTLYFRNRDFITPEDSLLWEQMDTKNPYYLEAMAAYLDIFPAGDQRDTLLAEYLRLGGKDPLVVLPRSGARDGEFETRWNQVKEFGGLSWFDVWERAFLLFPSGKNRERLLEELERYSGTIQRDEDRDGYAEEVRRIVKGKIVSITADPDQDGVWDLRIDFLSEKPFRMELNRPTGALQVFFFDYPRIDRILLQQQEIQWEYRYGVPPFLWTDGPWPPDPGTGNGNLPVCLSPLRRQEIERFLAFRLQEGKPYLRIETCTSCKRVRKYFSQEDRLVSFQEEQEIQPGVFRKRIVSFLEGTPHIGFIDVDGDGSYEVRESYVGGILDAIELLEGGKTQYRESLSTALREWDFNGDGRVDAREYAEGEGRRMSEYSSLLDSIFDERAWMGGQ